MFISALSKAQKNFSQSLTNFKFDCIDNDQTEEEKVIGKILDQLEFFTHLVMSVLSKSCVCLGSNSAVLTRMLKHVAVSLAE